MFKLLVLAALMAVAAAKPGLIAPLVSTYAATPIAYSSPYAYSTGLYKGAYASPYAYSAGLYKGAYASPYAYTAPLAYPGYSAGYVSPYAYGSGYYKSSLYASPYTTYY